jgi:polyhydroxybutyrate depolymerase
VGLTSRTIEVADRRRSFLVAEPAGQVAAIVLSLHGTRSNADRQAAYSRMAGLCETIGAVVVFPQAVRPSASGYEWEVALDVAFLTRLVDDLRTEYSPAAERVCMTGMSGGARMASSFAALRADLVGMVVAVAGLRGPGVEQPSRPVAILAFHGTADRINPYPGGQTVRWRESVPDAALAWARANGSGEAPDEQTVGRELTRRSYGAGPGEVVLWTATGAGHTWPGARTRLGLRLLLGRTTRAIDATREIGDFWQLHASDA